MTTIGHLIDVIYATKSQAEAEQLKASLVEEFVKDSDQAIDDLFVYIKTAPLTRWSLTVMQVLQEIGFPADHKALPIIVDMAGDINSKGYDIAFEMTKAFGALALPDIKNGLQHYAQDCDEYSLMIQGYCVLMEQLGSPIIDPLLPDLLHLLEIGTDQNFVYEYALWPIRKIGSPQADAALPIMRKKMMSISNERVRKVSLEALQDFEPSVVRPFMPILQECLLDQSEVVQANAQMILKRIEQS